jgi:hypothetical protein
MSDAQRGIRAAQTGILINATLAIVKLAGRTAAAPERRRPG